MLSQQELISRAREATHLARALAESRTGLGWTGYVGAALQTDRERIYTGVNLSLFCAIGFCAEHSAVADAVKHGETRVVRIVAVTAQGAVLAPCGRCRELLFQIDPANVATQIILGVDRQQTLRDLLPENWQLGFDQPLE